MFLNQRYSLSRNARELTTDSKPARGHRRVFGDRWRRIVPSRCSRGS